MFWNTTGCLDFLVSEGFFTADELQDALVYLQDGHLEPLPPGVARTVEVVVRFKATE